MDPRAFVKISIGALGVRVPIVPKGTVGAGVHASSSPFFCEVRLPSFPVQTAPVPLISANSPAPARAIVASFYLDESALEKLLLPSCLRSSYPCLEIVVYTGRQGTKFGVKEGKLIGSFSLPVSSKWLESKPILLHNGWTSIGKPTADGKPSAELHLSIKVEADPRYIFQFDGDTASSPQIVQVQGNITQPLFSCKFSRDRARLGPCETPRKWSGPLGGADKERKERKGWLIMIHDLSGSPVAAASMVTPFVPSAGTDKVSRSNPGAWLILKPDSSRVDSWEPWGRLEAWRERGRKAGLGLRFHLVEGSGAAAGTATLVSETVINAHRGGEFTIDTQNFTLSAPSPVQSPGSSGDCSFPLGLSAVAAGFVMSCSTKGDGAGNRHRPMVQLAMRHVTCAEDAAVFVALAAAVDLSVDACTPFSRKLRKALASSTT